VQFAPMYHDYVLYSDGSQEAPQLYRVRTFVPLGQEMESLRKLRNPSTLSTKLETNSWSNPGSSLTTTPYKETGMRMYVEDSRNLTRQSTEPISVEHLPPAYDLSPLDSPNVQKSDSPKFVTQHHPSFAANASFDSDFDPRRRYYTAGSSSKMQQARAPFFENQNTVWRFGQGAVGSSHQLAEPKVRETNHKSRLIDDAAADELIKLTHRRPSSEEGSLLEGIDIRGENDEYTEGFIRR